MISSAMIGFVVVTTSSSNVNLTRLCRARLGHMSEKGRVILSKQGLLGSESTCTLDFCDHCVFGKEKRVSFSNTKCYMLTFVDLS